MTRPPPPPAAARRRAHTDRGATAAEYAIMVSLVAVAVIGSVAAFGVAVNGLFAFPAGL